MSQKKDPLGRVTINLLVDLQALRLYLRITPLLGPLRNDSSSDSWRLLYLQPCMRGLGSFYLKFRSRNGFIRRYLDPIFDTRNGCSYRLSGHSASIRDTDWIYCAEIVAEKTLSGPLSKRNHSYSYFWAISRLSFSNHKFKADFSLSRRLHISKISLSSFKAITILQPRFKIWSNGVEVSW